MKYLISDEFYKKILEPLGLPICKSALITLEPQKPVLIEATFYMPYNDESGLKLEEETKQYRIIEVED